MLGASQTPLAALGLFWSVDADWSLMNSFLIACRGM
jgi:hypothetical protein